MRIGEKIKALIEESEKYDVSTIAAALDMSPQNLYKIFKKDSCETKYLEKLSDLLGVPIWIFFEPNWDRNNELKETKPKGKDKLVQKTDGQEECEKNLAVALATIQQMELRIKDKEEVIALLMKERK